MKDEYEEIFQMGLNALLDIHSCENHLYVVDFLLIKKSRPNWNLILLIPTRVDIEKKFTSEGKVDILLLAWMNIYKGIPLM